MGNQTVADPTGGAFKFSQFIEKELFPFIDNNYRTNKNERAIYGHSYGGLFGTYLLLENPKLFNKYLLLSPSLWYNDEYLIEQTKRQSFNFEATKLYMASGEFEGRIDDLQRTFVNILKEKKIKNLSLKAEIASNETHRTIFGIGLTNGLRYIYSK